MKLFLDTKARRFVKSAASNVALQTLHLKRRDQVPIEIVFVSNNAVVAAPAGTTTAVGLKAKFSDANFLAYAPAGTALLDLFTQPVETAFATNPSSLPALLEVRWSAPGESLRTATLQVELQNSVILGTEGTPAAAPDLKATQAEAEAGTDNAKWMTPLRTAQAIAELAPPTTDASLLTSGTLADARLSAGVTTSLTKADTASQPGHGHAISDVANLASTLAFKRSIPIDSSHSFTQSGQTLQLSSGPSQFIRITMSFANGSAAVNLPTSGSNYDEVIVDANVGANCTLTVGSVVLSNTNQYYGTGRRLLHFVRKNNIWNLYEHPYHTHTTNELVFAAAPQNATSPGKAGTISYAAGNLYVCVSDNQWRRVALATW